MVTWQGVLIGIVAGVAGAYLTERLVSGPARDRDRRANERRDAMRALAAAYDRAAMDVATVRAAIGSSVEDWTGPSVPSVWHNAFIQVRTNTLTWERDWQYVLGRGRRGRALKRQVYAAHGLAAEVQARLDISGWQADMALKQVAQLGDAIDALQRELRRRAAR